MEAKDTVMTRTQVNGITKEYGSSIPAFAFYGEDHPTYKLLKAQAEISFEAGERHLLKTLIDREKSPDKFAAFNFALEPSAVAWLYDIDTRKQAGIREVVEWIEEQITYTEQLGGKKSWVHTASLEAWQAKKKEWGIE